MHDVQRSWRKLEVACNRLPTEDDTCERQPDQQREQTRKHRQNSHSELVFQERRKHDPQILRVEGLGESFHGSREIVWMFGDDPFDVRLLQ